MVVLKQYCGKNFCDRPIMDFLRIWAKNEKTANRPQTLSCLKVIQFKRAPL